MTAALAARVHARATASDCPDDAATIGRLVLEEEPLLPASAVREVVEEVRASLLGLGPLEPLLADPLVSEVMVNGDGRGFVERRGRLVAVPLDLDHAAVTRIIERVVAPLGLRVDRASPFVDARLPDGSRVNAVLPPLAVDGPCLTIRRFRPEPIPLSECCAPPVQALLERAVQDGRTILVSGATGAGKTTLLNALAAAIPVDERVITIEDTAELRLAAAHVVRLEARPANAEGLGEVTVRALVRNALRMRPDRLVVGEVRGAEAFDLLQAMNTGHDGTMATLHANGPADALLRLETLALLAAAGLPITAVRAQVASALDVVVHMARIGSGRRVDAVAEVGDVDDPSRPPGVRLVAHRDGVVGDFARAARRARS